MKVLGVNHKTCMVSSLILAMKLNHKGHDVSSRLSYNRAEMPNGYYQKNKVNSGPVAANYLFIYYFRHSTTSILAHRSVSLGNVNRESSS